MDITSYRQNMSGNIKAWRISLTGEITQMEIIKECKEVFLNMIDKQPTIE